MRFWDSSALVPLVVREPDTRACRNELRQDPAVAVWCFTRVEIVSALRRQVREESLSAREIVAAERIVERLADRWTVVAAIDPVEAAAVRLLARHPLRAADAIQLAAALVLANGHPRGRVFVTRDDLLARAATKEGFRVVLPRG